MIITQIHSDIGDEIYTGGRLSGCHGDENPCRAAMIDQVLMIVVMLITMTLLMMMVIFQNGWGNGRCSWDGVVTYRAIK